MFIIVTKGYRKFSMYKGNLDLYKGDCYKTQHLTYILVFFDILDTIALVTKPLRWTLTTQSLDE